MTRKKFILKKQLHKNKNNPKELWWTLKSLGIPTKERRNQKHHERTSFHRWEPRSLLSFKR